MGDAVTWLVAVLRLESTIGVSLTTLLLTSDQVKGPTWAVISAPWLYAVPCSVWTWFSERQKLAAFPLNWRLHAAGRACWVGQAGGGELTGGTTLIWMLSMAA